MVGWVWSSGSINPYVHLTTPLTLQDVLCPAGHLLAVFIQPDLPVHFPAVETTVEEKLEKGMHENLSTGLTDRVGLEPTIDRLTRAKVMLLCASTGTRGRRLLYPSQLSVQGEGVSGQKLSPPRPKTP